MNVVPIFVIVYRDQLENSFVGMDFMIFLLCFLLIEFIWIIFCFMFLYVGQ